MRLVLSFDVMCPPTFSVIKRIKARILLDTSGRVMNFVKKFLLCHLFISDGVKENFLALFFVQRSLSVVRKHTVPIETSSGL